MTTAKVVKRQKFMEWQTDKMNYREDLQLINISFLLNVFLCMMDRLTDKVNYRVATLPQYERKKQPQIADVF